MVSCGLPTILKNAPPHVGHRTRGPGAGAGLGRTCREMTIASVYVIETMYTHMTYGIYVYSHYGRTCRDVLCGYVYPPRI